MKITSHQYNKSRRALRTAIAIEWYYLNVSLLKNLTESMKIGLFCVARDNNASIDS